MASAAKIRYEKGKGQQSDPVPVAELARYRGSTMRGRIPRAAHLAVSQACEASMLGMGSDREVERIFAWRLHLFAARVLLGQPRGRRRVRESRSEVLQRRCRQFMAGEWQRLWEEVR